MSSAGGPARAVERGDQMGAQVVQIFTQSPRAWRPQPITQDQADSCHEALGATRVVEAIYCHATYLINLASPDRELLAKSTSCFASNLVAAAMISSSGLIFHPGSHRSTSISAGIESIARSIARAIDEVSESLAALESVPVLFENTAGAGDTIGRTLEDLAGLIDRTRELCGASTELGVCIDTQHLWASGVNIADRASLGEYFVELDRSIGLDLVKAIHLNDSKVELGANRDRHENLGKGSIGEQALGDFLAYPAIAHADVILEVPGPSGKGPEAQDVIQANEIYARSKGTWKKTRK